MGAQNINNPVPSAGFAPFNVSGANAAGVAVTSKAGVLAFLNVNTADPAGSVTLYDGTGKNGTKIGTFDATAVRNVVLGLKIVVGLFVVTAGPALDVTFGVR